MTENQYKLSFLPKNTDGEWAQKFSDLSWSYLATTIHLTNSQFRDKLETVLETFHKQGQLTRLPEVVDEFEISGGRKEEVFRWALYLYTDGDSCPFDVRHFPVLLKK